MIAAFLLKPSSSKWKTQWPIPGRKARWQAMTDWLLGLVPTNGIPILMIGTFLSCLALPVRSSTLMLAAGDFAAA